jgi:diketogulonate reductase-like aldo/keto reductase
VLCSACLGRFIIAHNVSQMHWPVAFRHSTTTIQPINEETGQVDVVDVPISATWAAMEELVAKGKVRTIGVSNFTRDRIEDLLKTWVVPINKSPSYKGLTRKVD